ncbi:hypothetical protein [Salisaeta longa]|uniref:hypothetical protein n=1 Tax=Salisaeta longa TaxID=503170 RepID=UPI001E45FFBA|nr:hypothetical protein [Salisaeta longa]
MMRTFLYLAATLLLWGSYAAPARAQSAGSGTIYSRYGIGSLQDFSSSQSDAMGGGGYALRSLNYTNFANPALWSDQVYVRAAAGITYRAVRARDGRGGINTLQTGNIRGLQFSLPLITRELGFGLAYRPYSQYNYAAGRTGALTLDRSGETVPYQVQFEGQGGLHQIRTGLGWRVSEWLSLGATVDGLFGILESQRITTFQDARFNRSVVTNATRLWGLSGTAGVHITLADVLAANDALSIGTSVTLPTALSGRQERSTGQSLSREPVGGSVKSDVTLPWKARLGVSYQPDARWTIVADGSFAPWSNVGNPFPARVASGFPVGGADTFTNRWRASAGAEILPAGEDNLAGYFARTAYRFGMYAERLYVSPAPSVNLNEYALTAGISLPTGGSGTRIDINTIVGTRGTTQQNLVRDTFYGVSLNVSIGERWFLERKFR